MTVNPGDQSEENGESTVTNNKHRVSTTHDAHFVSVPRSRLLTMAAAGETLVAPVPCRYNRGC